MRPAPPAAIPVRASGVSPFHGVTLRRDLGSGRVASASTGSSSRGTTGRREHLAPVG